MTRPARFEWPLVIALLLLLLLLGAALIRSPAIVALALGGIVVVLMVSVTGRLALVGLEAAVEVAPSRLVAGEPFSATVTITNRKPLPLPWLDMRLFLPEGVEASLAVVGVARGWVNAGFSPRGRERVIVRFPLIAPQRGAYRMGPLRLRSGDWLGFATEERLLEIGAAVIVYPAPLAVRDRQLASLRPLAESPVRRGLLPDPLRFRGVRDHRRGDPRKDIHWKASARLAALQTKLYEPATSLDAVFLVNVASYEQHWIQADPEAVELVISATADLVRHVARAGRQVGLVTNGIDNLTHHRPRSALGRGPRPLVRSLEILARLGPYAANAPETVFLAERGRLPWGATLVVVTPKVTSGLAGAMIALRRSHHRVLALSVDAPPEPVASHLRSRGVTLDVLRTAELRRAA